jgi:phage/plasmid-associated DNA primase
MSQLDQAPGTEPPHGEDTPVEQDLADLAGFQTFEPLLGARDRISKRAVGFLIQKDLATQFVYVAGLGWHCWDGVRLALDEPCAFRRAATLADELLGRANALQAVYDDKNAAPLGGLGLDGYYAFAREFLHREGVRLHNRGDDAIKESVEAVIATLKGQAKILEDGSGRASAMTYAAELMSIRANQLDANLWQLVLSDGHTLTFDPDVNEWQATRSKIEHRNARACHVAYDSTARSDDLDLWRATFMPDDDEWRFLMEELGAGIFGGNVQRRALVVIGPTTSGKSQLIDAIRNMLGDYSAVVNASVFRGNLDDKPRPDVLATFGARLVIAFETGEAWELHSDVLKRMTGRDPLTARGMRSNVMITRAPSFTPVFVANEPPTVKGVDAALRRRLRALPLLMSLDPAHEDPLIAVRFVHDPKVHAALLRELIDGFNRARGYHDRDLERMPPRFLTATQALFSELSSVGRFVGDLREVGALDELAEEQPQETWVTLAAFHESYDAWARKFAPTEHLTIVKLGRRLRSELGWDSTTHTPKRWRGKVLRPVGLDVLLRRAGI